MNTNTYPFHKMRSGFPRRSRIEVERYRREERKAEGETKREKNVERSGRRVVHTMPKAETCCLAAG